jgi:hypothetical protein
LLKFPLNKYRVGVEEVFDDVASARAHAFTTRTFVSNGGNYLTYGQYARCSDPNCTGRLKIVSDNGKVKVKGVKDHSEHCTKPERMRRSKYDKSTLDDKDTIMHLAVTPAVAEMVYGPDTK